MSVRNIYFIDLFCGAGGVTTGIHEAVINGNYAAKVIACVNHDELAIKSHEHNHPNVLHYTEDIRILDITDIVNKVLQLRIEEPNCIISLWASLECTNFSKAKGGQPRDADSRTLAEHLFRYIEQIDPDYIWIENVEEFMSWGPLNENGKPISKNNGIDYMRWVNNVKEHGYKFDYKILNSADYGAYTSRKRFFAQFAKPQYPIKFPQATHSKNPFKDMFGELKKWRPVKEVLDFEDEGKSIFERTKDLSDKTLERIYAGLIKFVANGDLSFMQEYYSSNNPNHKVKSLNEPSGTITTIPHQSLVFVLKYNSVDKNGKHNPPSVDEPMPTITCQNRSGLVNVQQQDMNYMIKYYGVSTPQSLENPAATLTTKDRLALIQPKHFIYRDFKSPTNTSINEPCGALTTVPKVNLVKCETYRYLMNPQFASKGSSVEKPCFTLIAKMDKRPPYLITAQTGKIGVINIYEDDSEILVNIKKFMAAYGIVDIKMRMLKVPELLKIQGFPNNYYLAGNQTHQKKFIGNSVPPPMVKALIEQMYYSLN